MKSSLKNYKEYPFPFRFLISYIIVTVIGIVLMDMFAMWLITAGATDGFFNTILSILFALVAFAVGICALGGILALMCMGKKIYRGIGLYNFTLAVAISCPIVFIGMIIFMKSTNMTYTFFNFATLFLECCVPVGLMLFLRFITRRCDNCGLIKTTSGGTNTEKLGSHVKYHNEGGYYKDVTTTGKATEVGSLTPETFDVTMTTRQYVPKTTVRDGQFEKRRSTTSYKCSVCGNIMTSSFEYETKIGD